MSGRPTRWVARLLAGGLALLAAGVLVLATGAPASAHASLLETDPAQGAVLQQPPEQMVLTFNEPVRLDAGFVQGFTTDGSDWELRAEAADNRVIITPAADPGAGTVVVAWKVISADGHVVGGALDFSIGAPTDAATSNTAAAPAAPTSVLVLRIVLVVAAALGLLATVALAATRRLASAYDVAWGLGFGAAVLLAPVQQLAHDGRGLGGLADWLVWLDGFARWPTLLLLLAYLAAGLARGRGRAVALGAAGPALGLAVAAALTWPALPAASTEVVAAPAGPTTTAADLGRAGRVELTVGPTRGSAVTLTIRLVHADGSPLVPYRRPTLVVRNDDLTLGETPVRRLRPGRYRATVTIPSSGSWTAQVSVRIDEFDNPVAVVPFTVGGGAS